MGYFAAGYRPSRYDIPGYWFNEAQLLDGVLLDPGYWPENWYARSYWEQDYWPKHGYGPLLNAGYWPTTYWARSYWEPNYWPRWGAVVIPPIVEPPEAGGGGRKRRRRRRQGWDQYAQDEQDIIEILLAWAMKGGNA